MSRLILSVLILLPNLALAEVPMPIAGPACDDEEPRDGWIDDVNDCPDDFVRCLGYDTEITCLDHKECSWNETTSSCEGSFWDFISYIPFRWREQMAESVELDMGAGMHADRAWQRETGRWDTLIAVMDSGIRWHETDLQNKHYLNRGELPIPQDAGGLDCSRASDENPACPAPDTHDCNADCVFNVQDYANDPNVHAEMSNADFHYLCADPYNFGSDSPHPNSILEPGDLICAFADGFDDDGNGYVDDISGWDFLWDDPNPYDDTDFGHGSGEAKDSAAEGNNGGGLPGVCPSCAVMSVRVGDSFVCDTNNWANGIIFAVDSGAKVLQSAVGAINNTAHGQAAMEYAYDRGVINIMSAADETAQHQNYPGVLRHCSYVHAVRYDAENLQIAKTFLNFSNCTNFGGRLTLSAPSTGCSSGATGASSGVSGLVASAAQDAMDATALTPAAHSNTGLTGAETLQIIAQATDDIDLPTSQPDHPEYDPERYPSKEGWDMYFGYGRINARRAVDALLGPPDAGDPTLVTTPEIPPEADLLEPRWFSMHDATAGEIEIIGSVGAPRAAVASWVLEYAVGVEPDDFDAGLWTEIGSGTAAVEADTLGTLDPTTIADYNPEARVEGFNTVEERGPVDDNVTKARKVNRHTLTLRLRVTDDAGRVSEDRRSIYVHHDPTWKEGFPINLGVGGESSPKLYDLDGDGALEIVIGDASGKVHAFTADGSELTGWPVETDPGRVVRHPDSAAYTVGPDGVADSGDELDPNVRSAILATVAIGNIDGDDVVEVVAATLDGEIYAWTHDGLRVTGFPAAVPETYQGKDTNDDAFTEIGVFSAPALGDLDGDGDLEIVIATLDQQVIALQGDGSMVSGFPVDGPQDPADPTKPFLRFVDDPSYDADGQMRRIVSSPAIGDLDGDGNLEVVVGTNEALYDQLSVIHAFTYDRDEEKPVAYGPTCGRPEAEGENCWPLLMVGGYPNALPYVGEGAPGSPILGDLDGDGTLEVAAASIADFGRIYRHDGFNNANTTESAYTVLKAGGGFYGLETNSDQSSTLVMINSGAFGDVDHDGVLDYFIGAAGANFVDNLLEDGKRADFDHQLSGWSTDTGEMIEGFPQIMEDLQFFLNPVIADIDGDGEAEVINTSATFVIHAFKADGTEPEGWPKFTGQWQIGTPAVGDIDGDGLLELVAVTRAGLLFVYETEGAADGNVQWPSFRHDARNSGNFETPDPKIALPDYDDGNDNDDDVPDDPGDGCGCHGNASTSHWAAAPWAALGILAAAWRRRGWRR